MRAARGSVAPPPPLRRPRRCERTLRARARHTQGAQWCTQARALPVCTAGGAALSGTALWAALALCSAAGSTLAQRSSFGRALSAPVATMLSGAVLINAGSAAIGAASLVDPTELRALQSALVASATPLLLFGADLRSIVRGAGRLVPAFAMGAAGAAGGALLGVWLLGASLTGALDSLAGQGVEDAAGLSAALAAKNIGGGFNFVAVADSAGVSSTVVALGLAADNLGALLYFPAVNFWLAWREGARECASARDSAPECSPGSTNSDEIDAEGLTASLALSLAIVAFVGALGVGSNTIVAASAVTVALATVAPRALQPLQAPGMALARVMLGLFFASAGISGGRIAGLDPHTLLPVALLLTVIYAAHLVAIALAREVFGISALDAALCSNAAVGGPATAAALATARGADATPGVLLGNLGNATATFIALALLPALRGVLS